MGKRKKQNRKPTNKITIEQIFYETLNNKPLWTAAGGKTDGEKPCKPQLPSVETMVDILCIRSVIQTALTTE